MVPVESDGAGLARPAIAQRVGDPRRRGHGLAEHSQYERYPITERVVAAFLLYHPAIHSIAIHDIGHELLLTHRYIVPQILECSSRPCRQDWISWNCKDAHFSGSENGLSI